ncbi:outer membrane beta-barrel family protein [soil metagenome]
MRLFAKLLFTTVLLLCGLLAFGQGYRLTGTVVDSVSNVPIEFTNVILRPENSDSIITATMVAADGKFELLNVASGNYHLHFSFIGYQPMFIPLAIKGNLALGNVMLVSSTTTIDEAVVVGKKQLIVKNSEKTVYNVGQDPTNQIGNAEDVLRNMPGVSIDSKGNVTIIGKQGVRVLVDGKPNAMAENNLQAFLKSIPANAIESIEIITNPSARYDAEGNAGIINIKLKKGKADGFNSNISLGYGVLNRYNTNVAFNYRKKKFNVFGNYSLNVSKTRNRYLEDRRITVNDTLIFYELDSRGNEKGRNHNIKAGVDYYLNDKITLTYTGGVNLSTNSSISEATSSSLNSLQQHTVGYFSINDEDNDNTAVSNELSYMHKLDTVGQELVISLMHTYVGAGSAADMNSAAYDPFGNYMEQMSLHRQTNTSTGINNMIAQLDYVYFFKKCKIKGHKFDVGAKNETTLNNNVYDAYRVLGNVANFDTLLSNSFNYRENIAAMYAIYSGSIKEKFTWQLGLRGEHTFIKSNNNAVNRKYFSLFPNVTLGYTFNDKNSLSMSYSRRVQRPQFGQLNNTISYIDQYSTWQGNPLLQPSFSDLISISHSLMKGEHMFVLEAMGMSQKADFIESSFVDSNRITHGSNTNGSNRKVVALNLYYKLQLTKWWDVQMNHSAAYNHFSYAQGINTGSQNGFAYSLWVSTTFKFWKNTTLDINGWFNSSGPISQGRMLPVGVLNASIKKTFLKDKLSVSIAARNVLESMKWQWRITNTSLESAGSWHAINRVVMFTVSYQLGAKVSQRNTNSNDRLGGGGGR